VNYKENLKQKISLNPGVDFYYNTI